MRILYLTILLLICWGFVNGQGTWTQKADFPGTPRFDAMSFSIGMKGHIVGGIVSSGLLNDFWEYDAINNIWLQKTNFPGNARAQGVSFNIGEKGYIGTGATGAGLGYNDFWEYDALTDSWTQKANLPANGRYAAIGFSIGNKGYVGAGQGGSPNVRYNDFWEYDPSVNNWTQKENMPIARAYGFGLSLGMKGYIGTGNDDTPPTYTRNDFLEYDPATDNWVPKTSFPGGDRADIDGGCFIIGNFAFVGTGTNQGAFYNDFWVYNPISDTWASIPNLSNSGRIGASNFSINNRGYIGLGYSDSYLYDLWEYTDTTLLDGINNVEYPSNINFSAPNAFSPNNDGHNDLFILKGWKNHITEFTLVIYDRWGEKIYESKDVGKGWDGTFGGKLMAPSVFVYYINAITINGEKIFRKGNISLIK